MRSRGLIINGVSAPEDRYPYSASLQYNSEHFCGGSLVAPDFVVTAAHCTSSPSKITLGRYDLDDLSDYDFEVMDVVEAFVHPGYNKETVDNDIALLMLERQSIHPYVKLNADSDVPTKSDDLRVKGWGDIDPSDNGQLTSDELRETTVTYIPNEICEQSEGYVVTSKIKNMLICRLQIRRSVFLINDTKHGPSRQRCFVRELQRNNKRHHALCVGRHRTNLGCVPGYAKEEKRSAIKFVVVLTLSLFQAILEED